jgi:transcriptional regulator with XRE-family HTH domain
MSSVSEELRRERDLRGISLEEIADETKIGIRFLEAIEAGRLEIIPGEFYRRACLRAYALYIGLDADRVLTSYKYQSTAHPAASPLLQEGHGGQSDSSSRATKWAALLIAAVGLCGAAVAVWPVGKSVDSLETPEISPPPVVERNTPIEPVGRDQGEPVVRTEIEQASTVGLALRLRIKVNEPCWLEVFSDGELAAEGLMLRGFDKEIGAAEEIRFSLGNAGGVSIWLNDGAGVSLGRPGQVRKDIVITPENIDEYLAPVEDPDLVPVSDDVHI